MLEPLVLSIKKIVVIAYWRCAVSKKSPGLYKYQHNNSIISTLSNI